MKTLGILAILLFVVVAPFLTGAQTHMDILPWVVAAFIGIFVLGLLYRPLGFGCMILFALWLMDFVAVFYLEVAARA